MKQIKFSLIRLSSFIILFFVFYSLFAQGTDNSSRKNIFSVTRPIKKSGLSDHSKKALTVAGINNFGDLITKTEAELLRLLNFDGRILSEILEYLINIRQLGQLATGNSIEEILELDPSETILGRPIENLNLSDETTEILKSSGISYLWKIGIKTEAELLDVLIEGAMKVLGNGKPKNLDDLKKGTIWKLGNKDQIQNLKIFSEIRALLRKWGIKMNHLPSDWKLQIKLTRKLDSKIRELLPVTPPVLAQPIDDLDLSTRIKRALVVEVFHIDAFQPVTFRKINYLGELVIWTEEELLRLPNIGKKSLNEIKAVLFSMGLRLGMNIEWPVGQNLPESELVNKLNEIISQNRLTLKEGQILKMRFGIGENRHTVAEVSQALNIDNLKVERIKKEALQKLYHFGNLTRRIKHTGRASDLNAEQVEKLIKALNPEFLVDTGQCPFVFK